MPEPSFPRQYARTRRFSLGAPRSFTVGAGGERLLFLRSRGGSDLLTCLWALEVEVGEERLLADPAELVAGEEDLPEEERSRRERVREQAGGIVAYSADRAARTAAFSLAGRLFVADAERARVTEVAAAGPVLDPRPDPSGCFVAYVSGGGLYVASITARGDQPTPPGPDELPTAGSPQMATQPAPALPATTQRAQAPVTAQPPAPLVGLEGPEVTWGLAEFVAAEEMGRAEGYWWSPAGDALLVARVDTSPVARWYISDPSNPSSAPRAVAYPAAGTANAEVSLWLVRLDGSRLAVEWDRAAFEYVVGAFWAESGLVVAVESRDQRRMQVLEVDPRTGGTKVLREDYDPTFLDIVAGTPALTENRALVWTADSEDTKRLVVGDRVVTPPGLQVRSVLDVDGEAVLFTASEDPTEVHLWLASPEGLERLTTAAGVHGGRRAGGTTVISSWSLKDHGVSVRVLRGSEVVASVESLAERPCVEPRVTISSYGERQLRAALLWPEGYRPGSGRLPVLLDPYGGPHFQRVVASREQFLVSQWFADQGFAVLVADGRGTPGRGPAWDRSLRGDLATPVLEDQVSALHEAASEHPDLDLEKVAIRGWSFGGYLAALAVLRRPDVFHAAVAGAPVTDLRLYDTHYMERYLGHPDQEPENYERSSLIADAPNLRRPLLLIHGLADDNVVVAHTLRLSAALTSAGRRHCVLPLSGVTHMTPQEEVAENRLKLELDFLEAALGLG